MKKLLFIALAVILALSVGLVGCAGGEEEEEPAVWNSTITLTAHFTISDRASVCEFVYQPWIAAVEALTGSLGGKFNITATYGDSPFDDVGSLWGISSGVVDIGQLNPDTFKIGHIGYLPWLFSSMSDAAYVTYKLFADEVATWDKKGDLSKVKVLLTSPLWPAEYWGTTNVKVPADLQGLKVRAEYAEVDGISALGATPVNIGTSDLANSIMTHVVDGCFFTWSGIGGFVGLGEATQYTTQVDMFYRPYVLAMNKAAWDALPAEAQAKLATVCTAAKSVELTNAHFAGAADARQEVIDGPADYSTHPPTFHPEWGRDIYVPTPAELALWKTATAGVKDLWEDYLNEFNGGEFPTWGTDILARAQALIAQAP
jgi:TRAP-type C4-dicarboxylate transport system substrate-binding protein